MRKAFVALACGIFVSTCASTREPEQDIAAVGTDPKAAETLRAMSVYLRRARAFTFTARIEHETAGTPKLQYGAVQSASVRRPDRLRVEYRGDLNDRLGWFDGRHLTYLDPGANVYAQLMAGPTLDAALDRLLDEGGFDFPLAGFFYGDVYESLTDGTTESAYLGLHSVEGVECHHLYFGRETTAFQIWVDAGDQPLPRRFVITYRQLEQAPQLGATFLHWDLTTPLADTHFRPDLPEDALRIELVTGGDWGGFGPRAAHVLDWRHARVSARRIVFGAWSPKQPQPTTVVYAGKAPYAYADGVYHVKKSATCYVTVPPPSGAVIETLPEGSVTIHHEDETYYYYVGSFHMRTRKGYQVVAAPVGATVTYAPKKAEKKTIDGKTYYVYGGVYYLPKFVDGLTLYQVVAKPGKKPPAPDVLDELPAGNITIKHDETDYYYVDGDWFVEIEGGYISTRAPVGASVPYLPLDAEKQGKGFVCNGMYYEPYTKEGVTLFRVERSA
ncbi:MAG: DUF6515 family protein [Planctomycetota bacterium]|jgi:hypothetical protein